MNNRYNIPENFQPPVPTAPAETPVPEKPEAEEAEIPTAQEVALAKADPPAPVAVAAPLTRKFLAALHQQRESRKPNSTVHNCHLPNETARDGKAVQPGRKTLIALIGQNVETGCPEILSPVDRAVLVSLDLQFKELMTAAESFSADKASKKYFSQVTGMKDQILNGGAIPDEHVFPSLPETQHEFRQRQKVLHQLLIEVSEKAGCIVRPAVDRVCVALADALAYLEEGERYSAQCFDVPFHPGAAWQAGCTLLTRLDGDKICPKGALASPAHMVAQLGIDLYSMTDPGRAHHTALCCTIIWFQDPEVKKNEAASKALVALLKKQCIDSVEGDEEAGMKFFNHLAEKYKLSL